MTSSMKTVDLEIWSGCKKNREKASKKLKKKSTKSEKAREEQEAVMLQHVNFDKF